MVNHKRVVCMVPARGGSKGIPHKNLISFCGKPLLQWTLEQALQTLCIDRVVVSTEDEEIAALARKMGTEIVPRPKELAGDEVSSEEVLLHALSVLSDTVDIVVFLQATSPLRRKHDIQRAVAAFIEKELDSLFSASLVEDICLWSENKGLLKGVTFDPWQRKRRQEKAPYILENGSIYVLKPVLLHEQSNRIGGKIGYYLMSPWQSFEIDTVEDVEICSYFMKSRILKEEKLQFADVEMVIYDFDGVMTDNRVWVDQEGKEAVVVNRADGLAVNRLKEKGIHQVILSTESNPVVARRGEKLGIQVIQGVEEKADALEKLCLSENVQMEKVLYIGNDINDLRAMRKAGFSACPSDASPEILNEADLVLCAKGGEGIVRELLFCFESASQVCRDG